jgi:hypothetical protein
MSVLNKYILVFTLGVLGSLPASATTPTTSELTKKKSIVEKNLKTKISFDKKVKFLVAFQSWADKELIGNADKLSEEELAQLMQFSTLMKSLSPKSLTPKNCKESGDRVIDEDLNPLSEEPSAPAQTILGWLKRLCSKVGAP